jgi:hypothetical protein
MRFLSVVDSQKAHLDSCNAITAKLFLSVEAYITGVLQFALDTCASLKVTITPIFVCSESHVSPSPLCHYSGSPRRRRRSWQSPRR